MGDRQGDPPRLRFSCAIGKAGPHTRVRKVTLKAVTPADWRHIDRHAGEFGATRDEFVNAVLWNERAAETRSRIVSLADFTDSEKATIMKFRRWQRQMRRIIIARRGR